MLTNVSFSFEKKKTKVRITIEHSSNNKKNQEFGKCSENQNFNKFNIKGKNGGEHAW